MARSIGSQIKNQSQSLLRTGDRLGKFDQIRQRHFWSTAKVTPDANGYVQSTDLYLFQTPAGQAGQGFSTALTDLDTNFAGAGRVPDNQNLEIHELGVSCSFVYSSATVPSRNVQSQNWHGAEGQLLRNFWLGITYLTNTVPLGMASDFAPAAGAIGGMQKAWIASGAVATASDPARNLATNGFCAPALRRKFSIPILLGHAETFKFVLSLPQGRAVNVFSGLTYDANVSFNFRVDFWATESFVEKS
jgi:hypothetical protein